MCIGMIEMRTLTIGNNTYEIVDSSARSQIASIQSTIHLNTFNFIAESSNYVQDDNGLFIQEITVNGLRNGTAMIDLDVANIDLTNATSVLNAYSKLWSCIVDEGMVRLEFFTCPDVDIPLILCVHD